MHLHCAPIVLTLCKMLVASVGRKDRLYVGCRSTLARLLKLGPPDLVHWTSQRRLLNVILRNARRDHNLRWFLKYKDVIDFEARRNLVLMMLPEVKEEDELHEMLIDRSRLLPESFDYIGQVDATELQGGLFMEFKDEEATGPGVLREWFCLLCQAIFNCDNPLFLPCPRDHRRFFPNPGEFISILFTFAVVLVL
ncbi:hypothetical protein B296_00041766 [Ensete ventricosum]|uniref:HECT-type E3 ubiquitin transferase n=1 Tax=Ensete ventricosum TaxID=4639 RepID=A0A426ZEF0_ENSVE|nr:hypothetical protein B296_00041766 [Ensete ventricosum]